MWARPSLSTLEWRKRTADVILFVDIRPEIAPSAIHHLVSNFADPSVGCVAGELILRQGGHDGATAAVGGLYWRYEQRIRTWEAMSDSTVGVYGGFYAIRRELATEQPAGMILDDLFQPLSIIRQGYRSVLDPTAYVYDTWPESVEGEFHRKVRTLAGNFELFRRAPWTLTPRNRVLFQLISHKVMRLVVPYLFVVLLISALALSSISPIYTVFAGVQTLGLAIAIVGLHYKIPVLHRLAAPASAHLLLNAAAVTGLYRFLFTRGPLWKIWNASQPKTAAATRGRHDKTAPKPVAVATAMNTGHEPSNPFEAPIGRGGSHDLRSCAMRFSSGNWRHRHWPWALQPRRQSQGGEIGPGGSTRPVLSPRRRLDTGHKSSASRSSVVDHDQLARRRGRMGTRTDAG